MLESKYEDRRHSTALKPYTLYRCKIPKLFPFVPPHWHSEFELSLIYEGSAIIHIDDEEISVRAGDIVFIQPNQVHSIFPDENNFQIYSTLVFDQGMLDCGRPTRSGMLADKIKSGEMRVASLLSPSCKGYSEIYGCVLNIMDNVQSNTAENDLLVKGRLLELLYLLIKHGHTRAGTSEDKLSVLKPALKYISEHYSENITVAQLSQLSHLSESYFMFLFKKYIGHTAVEHIIKIRLEEVCRLLRTTDHSVTEIAGLCGFSNISNFNRHFLKSAGVSPSEYRKRLRNS